ncbi:MAG: hypothetical protein ABFD58_12545 [Anaerolineaceae bacterium]
MTKETKLKARCSPTLRMVQVALLNMAATGRGRSLTALKVY